MSGVMCVQSCYLIVQRVSFRVGSNSDTSGRIEGVAVKMTTFANDNPIAAGIGCGGGRKEIATARRTSQVPSDDDGKTCR